MSLAAFAPGPWLAHGNEAVHDADGRQVAVAPWPGHQPPLTQAANLRLIEDAPALYAELAKCAAVFRDQEHRSRPRRPHDAAAFAGHAARIERLLASARGERA